MPTYNFRNIETEEISEVFMSMSSKDQYLLDNPKLEQIIMSAPELGDPVRLGLHSTDAGFKEVLSKISENNYKSNLSDKLSRN